MLNKFFGYLKVLLVISVFIVFVLPILARLTTNAQSELITFPVMHVLAKDPGDNWRDVSGIGVSLPASVKYKLSVQFQSSADPTDKDINSFRRVKIYKASDTLKSDCQKKECWVPLNQVSNDTENLEIVLEDMAIRRVFITSWTPTLTEIRTGLPDKFENVESVMDGNKKGMKLRFASPVGATVVTIMPH